MTTLGDRSARLGNSPARTSTVFIVAKDPETHFGDTRPAFAGHGAVLLEVESREFYEHLADLIADEQPELAECIVPFHSVELKPGAMIRARKELARTEAIAANLGCPEFGTRDPGFRLIAETSKAIASHVEDLKEVLPEIMKGSERRLANLRRHAQVVRECWQLLNDASGCYSSGMIYVPHPLTKEIESICMLLEQSMPELAECDFHEAGKKAIDAMVDSITCVDPDGRDIMNEYMFNEIQIAEQFIARLSIRFGDSRDLLTAEDRTALDATRNTISQHVKRRERANKKAARRRSSSSDPLTDLLDKLGGGKKPATVPTAPPPPASPPATSSTASTLESEPVPNKNDLTIDVDQMTVHCNGETVTLDGLKHRRFKLLQLLLKRPGVAVSHEVLCSRGNPWHGNLTDKVTDGAIKSIVRELKKDLAPLGKLPVTIKTQTVEGELRPLLKRK
jgi:DNA-binding winged helix-turn-helix (wHTH) protein